jgi:serine/threonine-protein kinase
LLKILKSDLADSAEFRRRFRDESRAVAQLSHSNIMSVYDVSRKSEVEYIVMELIEGITLKQYMERRGQMDWREALHFITQIMRGLSHAHSRGIIHRDIKPQNIMVLRDGSVKVTDFGIACLENATQTLTQEALGSVHYISPEQAKGDRTDARSDIYSAGVVLYEMLAGRLPFEGENAVSVAIQHLSSIPLAPREINPEIPEQLELICMKAMASERNKRYANADAMIADLENFRKNPGASLDFELEDLRGGAAEDEPTMKLPTGSTVQAAVEARRSTARGGEQMQTERHKTENSGRKKGSSQQSKATAIRMAAYAGITVLALALVAFLMKSVLGSFEPEAPTQYVVPQVLGYTAEEAGILPETMDIFEIQVQEETVFSQEYPAGTIAKQDPAAGVNRKGDNLVIKVWLSVGEDTGVMIDVKDMVYAQARVELRQLREKYNLQFENNEEYVIRRFSDEVPKDYIIDTIPAVGEPIKNGDSIQFIISDGPELKDVIVPAYVDQLFENVQPQLETFGLVCTEADVEVVERDKAPGTILWQSIEPTTTVKEGTVIQFKVSGGLSVNTRDLTVMLPQDHRDTVRLEIYVGDETTPQVNMPVECENEMATVSLTGMGEQFIKIYFDGKLDKDQCHYMQFD